MPLDEVLLDGRRAAGAAASNEVTDHKSSLDFARWLSAKQAEQDEVSASDACAEPGCPDTSHEHSHGHRQDEVAASDACAEPGCTDTSHEHSHRDRQQTTAAARFGIRTFVYSQRRPFALARFQALVRTMPLTLSALPEVVGEAGLKPSATGGPFEGMLRSKGFIWLDCSHAVSYYWSQAGKYVRMEEMGRWWAAVPAEARPSAQRALVEQDFDGEWGDRRQACTSRLALR